MSACLCGALFGGCAGGSSSVAQSAGTIPSTGQRGTAPTSGRQAHSGARRTLSAAQCYGAGPYSFVGGPGSTQPGNSDNFAAGQYSTVTGGSSNEACDGWSIIAGGFDNLISISVTGGDGDGFIGGGQYHVVTGIGSNEAVVAGENNTVSNADSAIVAGDNNTVSSEYAFLGGGNANSLSGEYGVLVGGLNNTVSGEGAYIAAGGYNTASGEGAVIDGGFNSTAAGTFATIPGGYVNSAAGAYSFAAGARASAGQTGTFVWSDGSNGDTVLTSTRAYEFLARASGGVIFWTNPKATIGVYLAPGSGTWASESDRNVKTDVARLDDAAVLDKVASLPISRWSYKSERGVRHVGPMAQDFYAAFGVGEDDKHITSIDEDGVALAAIKALHHDNATLHARVGALDARNTQLRAQLASVQTALARLTAKVDALAR
jgi:hypothetical protein